MKLLIIALITLISIGIYLYFTSSKNKKPAIENFTSLSTVVKPGDIYTLSASYVSSNAVVYGSGPFAVNGTDIYNAAIFKGLPKGLSTSLPARIQIIDPQPKAYYGGQSNAGITTTSLAQSGIINGFVFINPGQTYTITVTGNADNSKINLYKTSKNVF